jgi:hypothetical protein
LKNYLETDQLCFIEDKAINYILKHEDIDVDKLSKKVFNFMDDTFDIKMKRLSEMDFMNISTTEVENGRKIVELLDQFVKTNLT